MNLNNQTSYWNKVAREKTFTHPLNFDLLQKFVSVDATIVDYGCGYGRVVRELNDAGCTHVSGFDTSVELVNRGTNAGVPGLFYIETPDALPLENNSVNCVLLFAVLTCIPENAAQQQLVDLLRSKLKPGGVLYVSDYYLQEHSTEMERYHTMNNDEQNFGVFHLPEGATFRHHPKNWIEQLFSSFHIAHEAEVDVRTMNNHNAKAFQLIAVKK